MLGNMQTKVSKTISTIFQYSIKMKTIHWNTKNNIDLIKRVMISNQSNDKHKRERSHTSLWIKSVYQSRIYIIVFTLKWLSQFSEKTILYIVIAQPSLWNWLSRRHPVIQGQPNLISGHHKVLGRKSEWRKCVQKKCRVAVYLLT